MASDKPAYPDISDILARKERGREKLASLSFGEKLEILEALRERDAVFRRARETRASTAQQTGDQS